MTVRVQDITVGRCYVTGRDQVRRVLEITANRLVRWVDLRSSPKPSPTTMSTLERFAIEVEHEVNGDDPRYSGVVEVNRPASDVAMVIDVPTQ